VKGREGGPEQRGLGTTLKLFLDQAISGAINLSRCGCRSHARASSARCTPRGRRGGGLVNPIVLVSHYISLIALSGGKSCKLVGISQKKKERKIFPRNKNELISCPIFVLWPRDLHKLNSQSNLL